jgi:ubiquinone/menaquinone biosynthesis C-methylase UbiE
MSSRDEALRPFDLVRRLRLSPAATVADIGAGAGYFTVELAEAVPRGKVIATDLRCDLLSAVLRRAKAAGRPNIETRPARRSDCTLESRSVDLAFLCQVDHHLTDRVGYFRTVEAALRDGGRMAILNFGRFFRVNLLAAREAGLELVDEWWPSSDHFLIVLSRHG